MTSSKAYVSYNMLDLSNLRHNKTMKIAFATVALISTALLVFGGNGDKTNYVWWEGEDAKETNFPRTSWFSPSTFKENAHLLSGGDWLSNSGKRSEAEAFAKYPITVPVKGEYSFWVRKFWKHGPFKWRFGKDKWSTCGKDIALADNTYLKKHVCANWVSLGRIKLKKGKQVFELRLLAEKGESLTCGFDCFLLTTGPFLPNGKLKPGEKSGLADDGYFAFEPPLDHFGTETVLDLRNLNEKTAGESGFVKREGNDFKLGNGKKVRFWAVNVGPNNIAQDHSSIDYLARRLAKLGVNMVRYHGPIFDGRKDPAIVNEQTLDNIFYLVSALKKQGIYTTLSFYFPLWFDIRPHYGIPGYENIQNKKPFGLLFFDSRMQEIYKSWAKKLLTTKNPYTNLPLGKDPAVGIVEIINEDSFFFWTFSEKNIPPVQWEKLERLFGSWLKKRYGSLEKAFSAWSGAKHKRDDSAKGLAGLYDAWHMTSQGTKADSSPKAKRISDQVRFLTEQQLGFYESIVKYFRKKLGVKCLISASNWKTADAQRLDALERYTYTAADVIDRHGYFGGKHEGEGSSYSVRVGHTYQDLAAVTVPERIPLQVTQVDGRPQTITELGWTNPNRFRADCAFLSSAYASLQGIDGLYFFSTASNFIRDTTMAKFTVTSPVISASFPAAALMYRRGDITEADAVFTEAINLENLFALRGSAAASSEALDKLREKDVPSGMQSGYRMLKFDELSFYVGRVARTFSGAKSKRKSLTSHIDRQKKVIKSVTGELLWNYGTGVVTVNTALSQGAAGFLSKSGEIKLKDISIECSNEYACLIITSLDKQPIATSKNILIQTITEEQPYGFKTQNGRITYLGGAPFGVRKINAQVTLKLKGSDRPSVKVLDENGYARKTTVKTEGNGTSKPLVIHLAEDALYHIVQR